MNRCNPDLWNAIVQASIDLENRDIPYLLIGSAALAAQGIDIEAPDADFLCGKEPAHEAKEEGGSAGRRIEINGQKIDHIYFADGRLDGFFALVSLAIDGVRVATPAVVMGIKRFADRPKDREDFETWEPLLAGVGA